MGVPVLAGSDGPVTVDEAITFLEALGPGRAMVLKAVAGGGGRGMRAVRDPRSLAGAFERARPKRRPRSVTPRSSPKS